MSGAPGGTNSRGGLGAVDGGGSGSGLPAGTGVVEVVGGVATLFTPGADRIPFSNGAGGLTDDQNFTVTTTGDSVYKFMTPVTLTLFRGTPPSVGIGGGASAPNEMLYCKGLTGGTAAVMTFKDAASAELNLTSTAANSRAAITLTDPSINVALVADFYNYSGSRLTYGNKFQLACFGSPSMEFDGGTNVSLGGVGGLATSATAAFPYLPSMAGAPTGTPTGITNMRPVVLDRTNNRLYANQGASAIWNRIDMRAQWVNTAQNGNVGAGETSLVSFTVPANTLLENGESFESWHHVTFAANANSKRVILKWGGTELFNSGAQLQNSGEMCIHMLMVRAGNTDQRVTIEVFSEATTLLFKAVYCQTIQPGNTLSGTNVLDVRATGASNNDIVHKITRLIWSAAQ